MMRQRLLIFVHFRLKLVLVGAFLVKRARLLQWLVFNISALAGMLL